LPHALIAGSAMSVLPACLPSHLHCIHSTCCLHWVGFFPQTQNHLPQPYTFVCTTVPFLPPPCFAFLTPCPFLPTLNTFSHPLPLLTCFVPQPWEENQLFYSIFSYGGRQKNKHSPILPWRRFWEGGDEGRRLIIYGMGWLPAFTFVTRRWFCPAIAPSKTRALFSYTACTHAARASCLCPTRAQTRACPYSGLLRAFTRTRFPCSPPSASTAASCPPAPPHTTLVHTRPVLPHGVVCPVCTSLTRQRQPFTPLKHLCPVSYARAILTSNAPLRLRASRTVQAIVPPEPCGKGRRRRRRRRRSRSVPHLCHVLGDAWSPTTCKLTPWAGVCLLEDLVPGSIL